jgi:hypothetical protein
MCFLATLQVSSGSAVGFEDMQLMVRVCVKKPKRITFANVSRVPPGSHHPNRTQAASETRYLRTDEGYLDSFTALETKGFARDARIWTDH